MASVSERSPLLSSRASTTIQKSQKAKTPLPKAQLAILLLMRCSEPIAFLSPFPWIPAALSSSVDDKRKIGYLAGIVESSFAIAQTCTIYFWGVLSDRVGRKPILINGLFGVGSSVLLLGFAKSFPVMVLARTIAGLLNGNVAIIKSCFGELTDETNEAAAFAILPLAWSTGASLGPALGGLLANPVKQYPSLFGQSKLFKEYPYLLASAVAACFPFLGMLAGILFLKETLPKSKAKTALGDEEDKVVVQKPAARTLLTRHVASVLVNYGMLAFSTMCISALIPLFAYTPIEQGGLALDEGRIGLALSCQAIGIIFFQSAAFPPLHDLFGTLPLYRIMIWFYSVGVVLFPMANYAARCGNTIMTFVFFASALMCCAMANVSYACNMLLVNKATPDRESLGAMNGLAQTVSSLCRALGPTFINSLFAYSVSNNVFGGQLVWIVLLGLTATSAMTPWLIEHH